MKEDTVTIPRSELDALRRSADWLAALEEAGVDNWEGISFAYELYRENKQHV